MIKIVKVPKKEAYYFCKRMFFNMFGDVGMAFANCLEDQGWVGHPYYMEDDRVILLYFINDVERFDYIVYPYTTSKKISIVVTDVEVPNMNLSEQYGIALSNIIDLTNLEDYYNTELNLDTFVKNILKEEK